MWDDLNWQKNPRETVSSFDFIGKDLNIKQYDEKYKYKGIQLRIRDSGVAQSALRPPSWGPHFLKIPLHQSMQPLLKKHLMFLFLIFLVSYLLININLKISKILSCQTQLGCFSTPLDNRCADAQARARAGGRTLCLLLGFLPCLLCRRILEEENGLLGGFTAWYWNWTSTHHRNRGSTRAWEEAQHKGTVRNVPKHLLCMCLQLGFHGAGTGGDTALAKGWPRHVRDAAKLPASPELSPFYQGPFCFPGLRVNPSNLGNSEIPATWSEILGKIWQRGLFSCRVINFEIIAVPNAFICQASACPYLMGFNVQISLPWTLCKPFSPPAPPLPFPVLMDRNDTCCLPASLQCCGPQCLCFEFLGWKMLYKCYLNVIYHC